MVKKLHKSGAKRSHRYVTTDDLAIWGGRLQEQINLNTNSINTLSKKVDSLDHKFVRLERIAESVLSIVEENNELMKGLRRLPDRVERLEKTVYH